MNSTSKSVAEHRWVYALDTTKTIGDRCFLVYIVAENDPHRYRNIMPTNKECYWTEEYCKEMNTRRGYNTELVDEIILSSVRPIFH